MKVHSIYTVQEDRRKKEAKNTKPSMTVPDQSMSVKEILERYARGQTVPMRQPIYHGDEIFVPDARSLDPVEMQEMAEGIRENLDERQKQINEAKALLKQQKEADKKADSQAQIDAFEAQKKVEE